MTRDELIRFATAEAQRQGVDPGQILPLIDTESSWSPNAVSPKGAGGIMQLMPATAQGLGLTDAQRFDPQYAIPAGIKYFKEQLDRFGTPQLAYAAYNAGPSAVAKYGDVPPFPETKAYVRKNMAALKFDGSSIFGSAGGASGPQSGGGFDGSSIFANMKPAVSPDAAPTPPATPQPAIDPTQDGMKTVVRRIFDPSTMDGLLAGEGSGVAKVGLGALHWLGKGLNAIGLDSAGNPLLNLSDEGTKKMESLVAPYRAAAPFSTGIGEFGSEVLTTAPIGGVFGKAIDAIAPVFGGLSPVIGQLGNSVRSGGLSLGTGPAAGGHLASLALRSTGGALTGGTQAALVNPDDAGQGFLLGAAAPTFARGAQVALDKVGVGRFARTPGPKMDTLNDAVQAGYVVPPSSVKPTFTNKTLESISGKIATAQTASVRNQDVTDALVRKTLGLADDTPLTPETLRLARAAEFQNGYEPLRNLGTIQTDSAFNQALDDVANKYTGKGTIPAIQKPDIQKLADSHKSAGFDSADAVDAIRVLRDNADGAFRSGDNALGKAYRDIATAYEQQLERAAAQRDPDMLDAYRAARTSIAKNFSVLKALRSDGHVDAGKLIPDLKKGKLSDDLALIAKFADSFPKAAQPAATVAGPGVHNLKAWGAGTLGTLGWGFGGPGGAALGAAPFVLPPLVRSRLLSGPVQRSLARTPVPSLLGSVVNGPTVGGALGRTLPLLGAQWSTPPSVTSGLLAQ